MKGEMIVDEWGLYSGIDLVRTGSHLKRLIKQQGYPVKDIQKLMNLSCPQPVYRWFKGQVLPSVEHLYVLSKLLEIHMEELLVPQQEQVSAFRCTDPGKRLFFYWSIIYQGTK